MTLYALIELGSAFYPKQITLWDSRAEAHAAARKLMKQRGETETMTGWAGDSNPSQLCTVGDTMQNSYITLEVADVPDPDAKAVNE